jgi:hypothetical protein
MAEQVLTYNMPAGIPGMVNRVGGRPPVVETQIMDPTNYLTAYGLAGQIDATTGDFRILNSGDTAIYGILERPYPIQPTTAAGFSGSIPLGTAAAPPTSGPVNVLKSGYMTVLLQNTTAAKKGGAVYARIQTPSSGIVVGGFEAAADGGNTILVSGAYFTGPADANNNVEVAFNI